MSYIRLLCYDIVTVSVTLQFRQGFSTKCIGYNEMCIGAHWIWQPQLHPYNSYCISTICIVTNTLCRETVTKSLSNSDDIVD